MKTMRFFLYLFLTAFTVCSIIACGSSKDEPETSPLSPVEERVKPYIDCASYSLYISAEAQTVEILATTNAKWSPHSISWRNEDVWIGNPGIRYDGEYMTVQFDVKENKTDSIRKGNVCFELQERETKWWYLTNSSMPTFIICQAAAEP